MHKDCRYLGVHHDVHGMFFLTQSAHIPTIIIGVWRECVSTCIGCYSNKTLNVLEKLEVFLESLVNAQC